ncbi:MAG: IMP cyclohydrolase [Clostridia bacterium]|nr:IMP cyclohydrolase [Clostridia bacterium]
MSFVIKSMKDALEGNAYPGRGIAVGLSKDGTKAMFAYFIMGRSENSRNRIFVEENGALKTQACDPTKMQDPSLIIYYPVKSVGKEVIVTNGDQTDTIEESLKAGKCFRHALKTRRFEPDFPNFTPRISALLHLDGKYTYEMSILKSADKFGTACNRYFFDYEPVAGTGHFIHTYVSDGNPLPSFEGEPELISVPNDVKEFAKEIWGALNAENRISLYCRAYDLKTGARESVLYNKYR